MKKIVMGIAAVACAATMFAADISAQLQIDGDLLNYSKDGTKALKVKDYDPSGSSDYLWKLSVNGDKAGAEIWSWNLDGSVSEKSIWLKPIDSLKLTVGNMTVYSCWNPQFGWWAKNLAFEKYGVKAEYTNGSLGVEAAISIPMVENEKKEEERGYWFDNSQADGWNKVSDFIVSATYALDAGKAQVWVGKGAGVHPHGFTGWDASDLGFGAVWGNCPHMQNGYFVDVAATFVNGPISETQSNLWADPAEAERDDGFAFEKLVSQIYGQYFTNGFGAQLINVVKFTPASMIRGENTGWAWQKAAAEFKYGFEAKLSYAIGAYTPYLQINGYDIMDKKLTLDLGTTTSVGACAIDAKVEMPINFADYAFSFSVPVQVSLTF